MMATNRDDASSILFNFENGASNVVNLDDNYDDDSDGTLLGDEFEDRFIRPTLEFVRTQPVQPTSNENVKRLDSLSVSGRTYRPGKTVELVDGDFLRITAIMTHQTSHPPSLKGIRFRRNKFLDGMLEFKRNEVTMLLEYDENDPRDVYHQSIKTVELFEILKLRELVKTNQPFPRASFRESDPNWRSQGDDYIVENGRIVCRTKRVIISKNEGWIQFLKEAEADSGFGMSATVLRFEFRGDTILGGQCQQWLRGEVAFDEADRKNSRGIDLLHFHRRTAQLQNESTMLIHEDWVPHHQQRYSFGDAFCGAGGISRGAKAAGLRIDWGFDFDPASIESYRRNFHETRCEAIAAHEFVTVIGEDFQVDILHLSPPCKTFSPFHVHPGQNDELNDATFFAIEELLKKVKPRIVTLEETFGLTRMDKNQPWFRAMIQVFTKLGFSVRWKVFNLEDFGLPQPRKRLFVFASW